MSGLRDSMGWGVLLAALTVGLVAPDVRAETVTLRLHHLLPPTSTAHQRFVLPWCERIEQQSGGELRCQVYPAMQLGGSPPQLYDQVRDGVADLVWTLPGYTPGRFPSLEVFELPFTMSSAEATSRALWEYTQTYSKAEFAEVHLLAAHTHGPGYLHMRNKAVHHMEDLRGLKVRAASRMTSKLLAALGATPVGMPVTGLPEALSRGVIDGALLPWEVVPSVKVHELTGFHTETDPALPALYTQTFVFAMNKARYESLSPKAKQVIDANSGLDLSGWLGRVLQEADMPARELAAARGNEIYTIPASEVKRWQEVAATVESEWIEQGGEASARRKLLEAARSLIEKQSRGE